MELQQYVNKKVLALGANKHKPLNYSCIGVIEKIDDDYVYIFYDKNPVNYQNYKVKSKDFERYLSEKLYKIK